MTDTEFDAFLETCHAELRQKQDELRSRFELGVWATWHYDQPTSRLTFHDSNSLQAVEAVVTFLGSFSPSAGTWIWGWANTSLLPAVRQRAAALQALADATGIETFRDKGGMRPDESRAWALAAIGVHQLGALGCYKGPSENSSVFLSIDEIRHV
jgi:hypothetical protein